MAFRSALIDGLFYERDGKLLVKQDSQPEPTDVHAFLSQFQDRRIQITVHHWPPTPIREDGWGGGCCMWQGAGHCPAGHHDNPAFILNVSGQGVLRRTENQWWLECPENVIETLPLDKMPGHLGRIVAVTLLDESDLTSGLEDFDPSKVVDPETYAAQMGRLEGQTQQLRVMMNEFLDLLKEIGKGK